MLQSQAYDGVVHTNHGDDFFDNRRDASYITRSSLMSGGITKLNQPAEGNVSYTLSFWGTTLQCHSTNRTIEQTVRESDLVWVTPWDTTGSAWILPVVAWVSGVRSIMDPQLKLDNTTITYRSGRGIYRKSRRYYPCLKTINETSTGGSSYERLFVHDNRSADSNRTSGYIDLPRADVKSLIPVTETVCYPRISRYTVTITHHAGNQAAFHTVQPNESIPAYQGKFQSFNGSFNEWVQFSDALLVYGEFAYNLAQSTQYNMTMRFHHDSPNEYGDSYTLSNGTSVDTYILNSSTRYDRAFESDPKIWPLSVFERRLTPGEKEYLSSSLNATLFDADMANKLLINSTIDMLSLRCSMPEKSCCCPHQRSAIANNPLAQRGTR